MGETSTTSYPLAEIGGNITIEYLASVNYAMYHNHCDTLLKCQLNNESESPWQNIDINIDGSMLRHSHAHIDFVPAKSSVDVTDLLKIDVDPEQLIQLSEGISTEIKINVSVAEKDVMSITLPLSLMAYDQWSGMSQRPELLAAFVTPNHPVISRILTAASRHMLKLTGTSELDEYQSQDPNRVRNQIAAVYEALRSEGLIYASSPASYEKSGQRIRTVDNVLDGKLGTCIDLSLLIASCLEAIGINPLIILTKGHCQVGAWLVKDSYTHPIGDDVDYLLKSSADGIHEIVVLEATAIANTIDTSFEEAVDMATHSLQHTTEFIGFIDVYRARVTGIRPLPLRVKGTEGWSIPNEGVEHANATKEVKAYDRYDLTAYATDSAPLTKYSVWERKLLDFTLRNNLLNMRLGKKIVPMVSFAIDKLEDYLQAGGTFQVLPFPLDKAAEVTDKGMYDSTLYPALSDFVTKELSNKRIHSFLGEDHLKEALKYVYRASRTSLEENGANNLYLVLGVLKWYETERSTQPRFAPILLLPIEIVRAFGTSGYVIRTRDEDIVLNITLAQLLKQQYGIDFTVLEELPKDESGVDVKKILAIVRDRIRNNRGWNVLDESMIGLFSFNKFVMWNDIHSNASKLHENEIISSLVDGKLNISSINVNIDAKEADLNNKPEEYIIPIDVDSSQLEAVIASGEGQSFILHGPPGTGKSQTITNMIANALYQGKRVLFVAEKMAALSVVQSRLEKIGLAPFCLELHSNKVTKRHFLGQMEAALDVTHQKSPEEYQRASEEIYAKRKELIQYIEALHDKGANGYSLYDFITKYLSIEGEALDVDAEAFVDQDRHEIEERIQKIADLDTIFRITGNPSDSPLLGLDLKTSTPEAEKVLKGAFAELQSNIGIWSDGMEKFRSDFGFSVPDSTDGINWALRFLRYMLGAKVLNRDLIELSPNWDAQMRLKEAIEAGKTAHDTRAELKRVYTSEILKLNSQELTMKWNSINSKWFLPRYFAKKSFLQMMGAYKIMFNQDDLAKVISGLQTVEQCEEVYQKRAPIIQKLFENDIKGGAKSWRLVTQSLDSLQELYSLAEELAMLQRVSPEVVVDNMANGFRALPKNDRAEWEKIMESGNKICQAMYRLESVASIDREERGLCENLEANLSRWASGLSKYKDWYLWCKSRRELCQAHMDEAIKYITEKGHSGKDASQAFAKGLYDKLARRIIDSDEKLRHFNGLLFDDIIKKYRTATRRFQELSKTELYNKLAANIPSQTMAAHENSEIGILKRNIKNGGRGTSIRKIIDQIPTLLPRLCPCMLMSPLSVAQYIDLDNEKFDIVIFDEASQMPTSEAVGAIARGKSLIVVGDPMQMPPTSFFATSAVGEEEAYIDDMESILDDCISLSIPSRYLTWHYRSKHESLISFSNSQYYSGRLFTFPSVDDQKSKVSLQPVEGVYDKGKSRSNLHEAQAVVSEVIRRLSDPELKKQSIGIVSFSKVQQDKIEDILTEELAKHPDLEKIAYDSAEPIFVKNLENVQGDERDVILFSIGYGPDKNGKVSMNFGPLNNAGGERRLNVAVSRARYEMKIFSSLKSEHIDLRRSNALGVAGLKKFLEYAESGQTALLAAQEIEYNPSCIAQQLADELQKHGYQAKIDVGRSQFRVDVAVVDPKMPETFTLGILLDGPSYYATKTVRDREIVQPTVLGLLNWQVMRVWTLDWYERKDEVIKTILKRLEDIKNGAQADLSEADTPVIKSRVSKITPEKPQEIKAESPEIPYTPAKLKVKETPTTIEELGSKIGILRSQLQQLINAEAPITNGYIYKRIVKLWNLPRVSPKLQSLVDDMLKSVETYRESNGNNAYTYWRDKDQSKDYNKYRTDSPRDIQDIPTVEITNAMKYVIDQQIAIEREDLKRLTANMLGFARLGSVIDPILEDVIKRLKEEGYVQEQGSKVTKAQ